MPRNLYLLVALIGTIIPWYFFGSFFAAEGLDIPAFVQGLFANGAAGGFTADVLISLAIFLPWSWLDAQKEGVRNWWFVLPASCTVGLSLALPLYLYLREGRTEHHGAELNLERRMDIEG